MHERSRIDTGECIDGLVVCNKKPLTTAARDLDELLNSLAKESLEHATAHLLQP